MASWTTPTTHATGDILSVSDWNAVANNETFLYQAPYCNYYNNVAVSLAAGACTLVTLGGTSAANYGFSISSNSIIMPLTGVYYVSGFVSLSNGGAGAASTPIVAALFQGGTRVSWGTDGPTNFTYASSSTTQLLSTTAGTPYTLQAYNFSSAPFNTSTGPDLTCLSAFFIGSQ